MLLKLLRRRCSRLSRFVAVVISLLSLTPQLSYSAQQGVKGPTSSGSIDIIYTMGTNVRISGLADINLGTWNNSGDLAGNDNLCIGRSGVGFFGAGSYRITGSGDGAPGNPAAFTLTNGINTIFYNAFFNDQTGTAGRQSMIPGVALAGQNGAGFGLLFNLLLGCASENANVSVVVPEAELRSGAGSYTGILTLLLIPE